MEYLKAVILLIINCIVLASGFDMPDPFLDPKIKINMTGDGPAIQESRISFIASVRGLPLGNAYHYAWSDNAYPRNQFGETRKDLKSNYSFICKTTGHYAMTLDIYKLIIDFPLVKIASRTVPYNITNGINGQVLFWQPGVNSISPNVVSTRLPTNVTFQLHDPSDFFVNATFYYTWFLDDTPEEAATKNISLDLKKPSNHVLMLSLVAFLPRKGTFRSGNFRNTIKARDPIEHLSIEGNTVLNHGDLLDLTVSCDGSPTWLFCANITADQVNETTAVCTSIIGATDCNFHVVQYIPVPGTYRAVMTLGNELQEVTKILDIAIYDVTKVTQISVVIIPVACMCLAVAIIVVGIAYHLQTRRRELIEEADFDFQESGSFDFEHNSFCGMIMCSIKDKIEEMKRSRSFRDFYPYNDSM